MKKVERIYKGGLMSGLNGISQAKVNIALFDRKGKQIKADFDTQQEIVITVKKALMKLGFNPFSVLYNDPKKITMDFIRKNNV